ncbi:MAG: N-acetyl-gamma-glutamyl-phosphate reductase [Planctomycetota bacterium]
MTRVAVIGGAGYTGGELLRLLAQHPECSLTGVFGSAGGDASRTVGSVHPNLRDVTPGVVDVPIEPLDDPAVLAGLDAVFLATPHEASAELAPTLLDLGLVVFDLSGGFRLPAGDYPRWYGFEHPAPMTLAKAVYGMPELSRDGFDAASLFAVPGCYPTASILPVAPLVRDGHVSDGATVIVDAVSGVSGAGRTADPSFSFAEVSLRPYKVLAHRHQPEIAHHAGVRTVFTPHLGAFARGIVATAHVPLKPGVTADAVHASIRNAYAEEPLVRVLPEGVWPSVGAVERTPFCDVQVAVDEGLGHVVAVGAIDNLLKGAASQAVQCFNARFGHVETAGLLPAATQGVRA